MSDWVSRKQFRVTNSLLSAATDYQIRFQVYRSTGTDSATNVYVGTNCQEDFSDIRWTDSTGIDEGLYDYWIETPTTSAVATCWVKMRYLPANSATTVYLYYNNPNGVSACSSGSNTFPFFDDFDGTSLDTSKWTDTSSSGTRTISNSIYSVSISGTGSPTGDHNVITAKTDTNDATVITCARMRGTTQSKPECSVRLGIKSSGTDVGAKLCLKADTGPTYNIRPLNEQVAWGDILQTYSLSTWYIFEIRHDYSSKFYYRVTHSGSWYNMTMNPAGTHACIHFVTHYTPGTTTGDVDWIYQRKYAATEPTVEVVESGDTNTTTTKAYRIVGWEYDQKTGMFTLEFGAVEDYYMSNDAKYRGAYDQSISLM